MKRKQPAQVLQDIAEIRELVQKMYPLYSIDEIILYMSMPQEYLMDQSIIGICVMDDISHLKNWFNTRLGNQSGTGF